MGSGPAMNPISNPTSFSGPVHPQRSEESDLDPSLASPAPRRGVVLTAAERHGIAPSADWSYWVNHHGLPAHLNADPTDVEAWRLDIDATADLGATEIVLTPEWSRLEPQEGSHDPVEAALWGDVISHAKSRQLRVWLCLIDGTAPGWFTYDEHGFGDRRARSLLWPRHVEWMGETFGHLADGWIPMRESAHLAVRSRTLDLAPPGGSNVVKGLEAIRDRLLAEADAWRILRGSAPVATYQTMRLFIPETASANGRKWARDWDRAINRAWINALTDGHIQVGDLPARHAEALIDAFDQIMVQLRPPVTVSDDGEWLGRPVRDRKSVV